MLEYIFNNYRLRKKLKEMTRKTDNGEYKD